MSNKDFILKIPTRSTNLKIIRDFIMNVSDKAGFENEACCDIALAVDEGCTNVIKHAYRGGDGKDIIINVKYDKEKITIIISDTGKGFDSEVYETLDLEEYLIKLEKGGLGIHIMKNTMDEIDFRKEKDNINSVHMIKFLPQESAD